MNWMHSEMLDAIMVSLTALGSGTVLTLIVIMGALILWCRRDLRSALQLILVPSISGIMVRVIKFLVARPRPDLTEHLVPVTGFSFPSGHAMNSVACFMTISIIVSRIFPTHPGRFVIMIFLLALSALIAFSRVYLGVHYPGDVIGGYFLGLSWAWLFNMMYCKWTERNER